MVDISIAVVAFNDQKDIEKLISAIDNYTSKTISKKIYIVDNSTEINDISKLSEKFNDVIYIKPDCNLGFGKGHNYVISELDSKYHAIVNPDVYFKEDVFQKILKFMSKDQTIGMIVPKIVDENGNLQLAYRREITLYDLVVRTVLQKIAKKRYAYHTMQDMDYNKPFEVPFAQGSFLVIQTELFRKLKGFDERYFMYLEDADLCKKVNSVSHVVYFPNSTIVHRWERGSHKNRKLKIIHIKSFIKYFKIWGIKIC